MDFGSSRIRPKAGIVQPVDPERLRILESGANSRFGQQQQRRKARVDARTAVLRERLAKASRSEIEGAVATVHTVYTKLESAERIESDRRVFIHMDLVRTFYVWLADA